MAPLVSVIMPCYNAGPMLEPALWSVFAQTHPNIEFIFVDNNSTDASAERAQAFAEGRPTSFRLVHCARQGANNARNLGYSLARGDYIQWMDADDALGVEKIALQVEALERDPAAAIAYCDWMSSRHLPDGNRQDHVNALTQVDDQILRTLSGVWYPPHSYLVRRDAAERLQAETAWMPERKIGTDVEYSAIAAMLGLRFRHVPSAKVQYNTWSNSQTSGAGTPYEARIASLRAIWRRLGEFAHRPDVAPRITATHRTLLEQDWNVWAMPPGSAEIATVSASTHSLRHVVTGRTLELSARDATIATVMLAMGLNRAICHHAVQIAAGVPALRDEHAAIVATLERFRQLGFLTLIESVAEAPKGRATATLSRGRVPDAGASTNAAASQPALASPPAQTALPPTREVVAKAWTEVLRGHGLAENERFDAAGGDSLALLNFALSCEAHLGIPVSLDALSTRMRPSDLARVLDRLLSESGAEDVAVETAEPDLPTIFLIRARHHMDQSEVALRQACAGLARIVPIPLPPWPVLAREDFDFQALLDHIVRETERQPGEQPVTLFGLCFGGMLAHAAATRLAARGRRIGFLAILDGDADWALGVAVPPHLRDQGLALRRTRQFTGLAPRVARWIVPRPRVLRWVSENRRLEWLPRKFAAHLNWHLNTELPRSFDRGGLGRLLTDGGRLEAPVFLLRSLEQAQGAPADLHWRKVCARLTVVPILGDHYHLFTRENLPVMLLALANVVRLGLAGTSEAPRDDARAAEDDTAAAPRRAIA